MNCMKRIGYYCLMLLAFASCSRSPQPMEALYPVQGYTDLSQEKVKLSSLFAEYRLIPLETNDSSLIGGRGNKVLQRDSSFYIESENTILSFDNDGHFISRFDKRGSGPEDYIDISDFDVVSSSEGKTELWLSGAGGIKVYDALSGAFIRGVLSGSYVHQFQYVNDSTLLFVDSGDEVFHVCDLTGKERFRYFKKDLANSIHKFNQFFFCRGKICYQLGNTLEAIVYDPDADACSLQPILPAEGNVLTPQVSRDYYDKYGYLEQDKKLMENYVMLSVVRTVRGGAVFEWIAPGMEYGLSFCSSDKCHTIPFSAIDNDICETDDNRFLATLTCCESDNDSVLLFQVPDKGDGENNFSLLEAVCKDMQFN
ncbi:hypothetical protein B5G04_10750 [Bacteroides sp. An51A]|nr:hypothetical protein B5G04_10750 [Bacteroides sp. An51A]OUP27261.1 hypothetical protein B5F25_19305 [Bacteroides sp. An19]